MAIREVGGTGRPNFEVRHQNPERRFAFDDRRSELAESAARDCGTRSSPVTGSDFGIARIVGVFDATIAVPAA
jgi:hypothetical protein